MIFSLLNGLFFPLLGYHPDKQIKPTKRRAVLLGAVLLGASKPTAGFSQSRYNLPAWCAHWCIWKRILIYGFLCSVTIKCMKLLPHWNMAFWGDLNLCSWAMATHIFIFDSRKATLFFLTLRWDWFLSLTVVIVREWGSSTLGLRYCSELWDLTTGHKMLNHIYWVELCLGVVVAQDNLALVLQHSTCS